MATQRALVVGSGVIGLRTSLELLRRNISVVLKSPRSPLHPSTCSMGAGGLWMPFHCDDPRTNRWAKETLYALLSEKDECVEIVPTVVLQKDHQGPLVEDFIATDYKQGTGGNSPLPEWSNYPELEFQHLTVEMLAWQNHLYKLRLPPQEEFLEAGYRHAWFFRPPIVDAPRMLEKMLYQVQSEADHVDVETGVDFQSIEEMVDDAKRLDCDALVNCTGLGAATICKDTNVVGARGVLFHFDRSSCVRSENWQGEHDAVIMAEEGPWGSETHPCYLIPRGDVLVVGGTYLEKDTEATIRPAEREQLLKNADRMGIDTLNSPVVGEWTGFRPYRETARCELQADIDGVRVAHSYGYGGSGWTVYVGVAQEIANLLESTPKPSKL